MVNKHGGGKTTAMSQSLTMHPFDIFVWSLMGLFSKTMTFIWLNLHA